MKRFSLTFRLCFCGQSRTEHTVLGRIGTVAMGLGCGGANGAAGKNYVVEGTELMEYTHYNVSAECSDTANANTTTTLDQCVESSTGVYEKVKLVTAPGTLTIIYDVGDENCSGAPISTSLSPMLCVASNPVAGFLSRLPSCYGEKQLQCYYSNSDCTGSQMCSPLQRFEVVLCIRRRAIYDDLCSWLRR